MVVSSIGGPFKEILKLLTLQWLAQGKPINGEGVGNGGLASIDRNNKATLLFTAPYYTIKSYAKVLFLRMVKLQDVS